MLNFLVYTTVLFMNHCERVNYIGAKIFDCNKFYFREKKHKQNNCVCEITTEYLMFYC